MEEEDEVFLHKLQDKVKNRKTTPYTEAKALLTFGPHSPLFDVKVYGTSKF